MKNKREMQKTMQNGRDVAMPRLTQRLTQRLNKCTKTIKKRNQIAIFDLKKLKFQIKFIKKIVENQSLC